MASNCPAIYINNAKITPYHTILSSLAFSVSLTISLVYKNKTKASFKWYHYSALWKESLNSEGQQFNQYQQNKQSPSPQYIEHNKQQHYTVIDWVRGKQLLFEELPVYNWFVLPYHI
jgi:hypothetical protein